jgi:hypothetical protein
VTALSRLIFYRYMLVPAELAAMEGLTGDDKQRTLTAVRVFVTTQPTLTVEAAEVRGKGKCAAAAAAAADDAEAGGDKACLGDIMMDDLSGDDKHRALIAVKVFVVTQPTLTVEAAEVRARAGDGGWNATADDECC